MELTAEQDRALKAVAKWMQDPDQQCFKLFGYAGTGKTTLAKYFADNIEGQVLYMSFTGKAAYVLRQKGCEGASTIHSFIYRSADKGRVKLKELEAELASVLHELRVIDKAPTAEIDKNLAVVNIRGKISREKDSLTQPMFTLNTDSDVKLAKLVVVDEVSQLNERMGLDLLSFGVKVLVLGDPAQLPPVAGAGFFTDGDPDFMLTEIHRQVADSPIIQLATLVRQKNSLLLGNYGSSKVIDISEVNAGMAKRADQILVGRNKTRHLYNNRLRILKGMEGKLPVQGDRLVCLRNNHELGLLNGAIWYVKDITHADETNCFMTIIPEGGGLQLEVDAHSHYFLGTQDTLSHWDKKDAEEFDYGYALTVHKAQGSQWDNVLIFDESDCFRSKRWNWLYTAITRAAEQVTIVRM